MANDKIRKTSLVLTPDGQKGEVRGLRTDIDREPAPGQSMGAFLMARLPEYDVQYALVRLRGRYAFYRVADLKLLRNWAQ